MVRSFRRAGVARWGADRRHGVAAMVSGHDGHRHAVATNGARGRGRPGVLRAEPRRLRGYPIVDGEWGQVTFEEETNPALNRLPRLALRARNIAITRSGPNGFWASYTEWKEWLGCHERSAQRTINYLECAGFLEVARSSGGGHGEKNWYRLRNDPPREIPVGLKVREGVRKFAARQAEAAAPTRETAAAETPPPPPAATSPEPGGRWGAIRELPEAGDLAPADPTPEQVAQLREVASPSVVDILVADLREHPDWSSTRAGLWDLLEAHGIATAPRPDDVWALASRESARTARTPADAARDYVLAFHELGLGRVDHSIWTTELTFASQLLARNGHDRAWEALRDVVTRFRQRMARLGNDPQRAESLVYLRPDFKHAGLAWMPPQSG